MTRGSRGSTRDVGRGVTAWRNAVFAVFVLNGFEFASWVSRIPGVRDSLHLRDADVGLLLLCISVGAIVGLTLAPTILARFGSQRGIVATLTFSACGLTLASLGASTFHDVSPVAVGLVMLGMGNGAVDVIMNVEGTVVERAKGTTQMPLMHAGYSLGTVVGAGLGAGAAALHLDTSLHLPAVAILTVAGAIVAVRFFGTSAVPAAREARSPRMPLASRLRARMLVWADLTLICIGVVILGMAFTEGSAGDWLALAVVDGHHQTNATGALFYGVFVAAMTVGRALGGPLVDRIGRVSAIRGTAALGIAGLLLFILGGPLWVVVAGTILWGLGCALGFPLGVSAAADNTDHPAERVSAVAMIGYFAFLVGPPAMGFLAQAFGLLHALFLVLGLLVLSVIFAGHLRHRGSSSGPAPDETGPRPGEAAPGLEDAPSPAEERSSRDSPRPSRQDSVGACASSLPNAPSTTPAG